MTILEANPASPAITQVVSTSNNPARANRTLTHFSGRHGFENADSVN